MNDSTIVNYNKGWVWITEMRSQILSEECCMILILVAYEFL